MFAESGVTDACVRRTLAMVTYALQDALFW